MRSYNNIRAFGDFACLSMPIEDFLLFDCSFYSNKLITDKRFVQDLNGRRRFSNLRCVYVEIYAPLTELLHYGFDVVGQAFLLLLNSPPFFL